MLSPDPATLIRLLDEIQRYLVERTRLGIPAVVHHEALTGLVHQACVDYPTAISLGAAWDPASVEEINDVVRREMRALGVHQALSPVLDIARDARWGRVQETYGEDPYLGSAIARRLRARHPGRRPARRRARLREALPRVRDGRTAAATSARCNSASASCSRCTPGRSARPSPKPAWSR